MADKHTGKNRRWTAAERAEFAQALADAPSRGLTKVCRAWGCGSIGHALGIVGARSIYDLRHPNPTLLKAGLFLRFPRGGEPARLEHRGSDRFIVLTVTAATAIMSAPLDWLQNQNNLPVLRYLIRGGKKP